MSQATVTGGPPPPGAVTAILLDEGHQAMRKALLTTHGEVLRRMERHRRTGTMMRSVFTHAEIVGTSVVGVIGSNLNYAKFHEYGTGLYGPLNRWITPRNASVLRFPQPGNPGFTLAGRQRSGRAGANARWVYARRVRGMRPMRYFRDSALVTTPIVDGIFRLHGRQAADRIMRLWRGSR